jgi:hypothetical protein
MFTVTSLAWTYSSLVASERIQRDKQTEDKGRIQSTGEVVVSSTGNERYDKRRHHSYLRSCFNLVSEIRARLAMKFCWRLYKDVKPSSAIRVLGLWTMESSRLRFDAWQWLLGSTHPKVLDSAPCYVISSVTMHHARALMVLGAL